MKKYIIMGALLVSGMISANNIEPKLEAFGDLVKVTYYYDNGQVQQTGFFKDGRLEGQWVAYDASGNKKSIGEYSHGIKTGKWVFWTDATLNEVTYVDNTVSSVKKWKQEAVANRN
jgi:antitoxin component YwqK of YwqJK toxin-antitoxin module